MNCRASSSNRCRTGISCSASPRCSARTSATTAICSKTSAASPTSANRVSAHEPAPARRRPRYRHGHSHLRPVSGLPSPPARAGGRQAVWRSGVFHIMPESGLKPLEDLFRARVITFLVDKGLLPGLDAARLGSLGLQRPPRTPGALPRARGHGTACPIHHRQPLFGRKDVGDRAGPGFGIRIDPLPLRHEQEDLFEVFTPCDFIAAITQHIADKSFQLVRYLRVVFQQHARAAGPGRRRKKRRLRGRRRVGDRRFRPRAAAFLPRSGAS